MQQDSWESSYSKYYNEQHQEYNTINPFVPNTPFLYPLKTSENRSLFYRVKDAAIKLNEKEKQTLVFSYEFY